MSNDRGDIYTLEELCEELGEDGTTGRQVDMEVSITNTLQKDTACSVTFWVTTTVHVAGYTDFKGYVGELTPRSISFPFTEKEFWGIVRDAEADGCRALDKLHGEVDD